jgi:hypothetical protein
MKNNNALFYTCSLLEYIGRRQKLKRSAVVAWIGERTISRIYCYADVFCCELIEKTADDFIVHCGIPTGTFDNVAACRYTVPDYWTIGEVYERLIEDVAGEDENAVIPCLVQVYLSWIDAVISNYNTDFYYQSREYIYAVYNAVNSNQEFLSPMREKGASEDDPIPRKQPGGGTAGADRTESLS